jgi:hypothetical protein
MWLIMRGALDDKVAEILSLLHRAGIQHTAVGHIIPENKPARDSIRPPARKAKDLRKGQRSMLAKERRVAAILKPAPRGGAR